MRTHIQILAWLHIVFGVLAILGGLAFGVLGSVVGAALGSTGGHTGSAAAIGGIIGLLIGGSVIVFYGLPGTLVGSGMLKLAPWSRIGGIILAILDLLFVVGEHRAPSILALAFGIYGLWVLFNKETIAIFEGRG